jgi:peptidoglycan L-alanyl-D-glutamate endopeptidase CwlK
MAQYYLSKLSQKRLMGVHPDLIRVVKRAIEITTQDFMVLEGVRTKLRQAELYAQGRTKPGEVVTWTMNSRHFIDPKTGYSHAVDLVPFPLNWKDITAFDAMADAMKKAAKELGISIRWGADWDRDGKPREKGEKDSPHFELVV